MSGGFGSDAARALVDHPQWLAIHESTLAKLEVVLGLAADQGWDVNDLWNDLTMEKRRHAEAVGLTLDDEMRALSDERES